jgi:hypothetical protein
MEVDYYGAFAFAYPHKSFARVPLPAAATPIVDDEEEDLAEFARMLDAALEANGSVEEGPAADEAVYFGFAALALALEAAMDEDGEEYQDQESHDVEAMDES